MFGRVIFFGPVVCVPGATSSELLEMLCSVQLQSYQVTQRPAPNGFSDFRIIFIDPPGDLAACSWQGTWFLSSTDCCINIDATFVLVFVFLLHHGKCFERFHGPSCRIISYNKQAL